MNAQSYHPASRRAIASAPDYFLQHQAHRQRVSATVSLPDMDLSGMTADDLGHVVQLLDKICTIADTAAVEAPFAERNLPGTPENSVWERQSGIVLAAIAEWAAEQSDRAFEAARACRPRPGSHDAMQRLRVLARRHVARMDFAELEADLAAFRADAAADEEVSNG